MQTARSNADVTAREAAKRLGVSIWTIYRRCRKGALVAVKRAGRWLITLPAAAPDPSAGAFARKHGAPITAATSSVLPLAARGRLMLRGY